eukprot:6288056-Pyramimonas_sp.AAC.2
MELTLRNNTNEVVSIYISQRAPFKNRWMKEQQTMPRSVTSICLKRAKTILDWFRNEPTSRFVYLRIGEDANSHSVRIDSDNNDCWFDVVKIGSYILE